MSRLQEFLNSSITDAAKMRRNAKAGDLFGLELECEGRNVDYNHGDENIIRHWAPHNDGSLRANHGSCCEWVFNGPVPYKAAVERVNILFDYFEKRKAKLVCSNRTSTHVHYNMGDKSCYQLVNMFILFTILEGLLDRYCGEDRAGNLFCLSSRHAEQQIRWMEDAVFKHGNFANLREDWRYCSFNFAAVNKFGTVEFRAMRGLDNREDVLAWLSIINDFCDYASYKMKNPIDVVQAISAKTPIQFLHDVFSRENWFRLTKGIPEHEINASIYEGLRLVQMLCYRVGTEFDQVRLRGRDFWASFKEDKAPDLDVDPEAFARGEQPDRGFPRAGGGLGQAARWRRGGGDPFRINVPDDVPMPDAPVPDPDFNEARMEQIRREQRAAIAAFRGAQVRVDDGGRWIMHGDDLVPIKQVKPKAKAKIKHGDIVEPEGDR
jgi:hypothetical protein